MKIVHVVSAFDVEFPGGITKYVKTLGASQAADGHEVLVIDGARAGSRQIQGFAAVSLKALQVRWFGVRTDERRRSTRELMAYIESTDPDIVHFHSMIGLGLEFFRSFPLVQVPYVISLHDYFLCCPRFTLLDNAGNNCVGPSDERCSRCVGVLDLITPLYRASIRTGISLPRIPSHATTMRNSVIRGFIDEASVCLPVSSRVGEIFRSVYPTANYSVCHIGNESAVAERPEKIASRALRLTMIGTLDVHKGAEVLIDLVSQLKRDDVDVRFYGRVDNEQLGRRCSDAGVRVMGPYRPSELGRIMAETDVGLALPIWEDNGPQTVMEFLNFGVPVVATRRGGIPDFVNSSNGLLFEPSDPNDVAAAAAYISALNVAQVRMWGASLDRLKTPAAHAAEIVEVYVGVTKKVKSHSVAGA